MLQINKNENNEITGQNNFSDIGVGVGNYNLNNININKDNNEINSNEILAYNSDNDVMNKKEFITSERISNNIINSKLNKIKKENKNNKIRTTKIENKNNNLMNQMKSGKIMKSYNEGKNTNHEIIVKDKMSKTKENFAKKKIHKNNTMKLSRLNKNIDYNNPLNMRLDYSNSSTTISKTLNKSYKSSMHKIKNKSKIEKNEIIQDNANDKECFEFNIPNKYLNQDSKVIKSLNKEGKIINIYSNNKVEVIFKSGVKKEVFEDGYQIVHFSNGDLKQIFPDGKMIYYFKDSKVTQTTYKNGLQIFKFSNGQVENHYADGSKQITFPDGTIKYIYPNGYEETWDNEKNIQQININLNNNKEVNKLINEEEG